MLRSASWLAILVVMACGEPPAPAEPEPRSEPQEEAPAPQPPRRTGPVRAEIRLGQFESDVTDLTFWEAQPFGFQSQVFAANGASGIVVVRADGGGVETIEAAPAAIFLATAMAADGEALLVSTNAAGGIDARALGDLSAAARTLTQVQGPRDLCSDGAIVLAVSASGARAVLGETTLPLSDVPNDTIACAAAGGDFYFQSPRGWDRLTASGMEPTPLPLAGSTVVAAGEQVFAIAPGTDGKLHVNEKSADLLTPDGETLRPLMVAPAYGNFGGVLRDGALIVLDEQRNLYLVGWAGVANALGLPTQLASIRAPMSSAPVEFNSPDDDLELDLREPVFEEQEAPLPPGQQD